MQLDDSLFKRIKNIQSNPFLFDFCGGLPLANCYLMVYLACYFNLKSYVEIGVYKGRSLFSVAQAFKDNEGKAYGIDPYSLDYAKEYDLEESLKKQINSFLSNTDFEAMYTQVLKNIDTFELSDVVKIIRKTSTEAAPYFKNIGIDMLYIDGNHDRKEVQADINNYTPLLRKGGIIIFNCINWPSVNYCYNQCKKDYIVLFETESFGILIKKYKTEKNLDSGKSMSQKLENLYLKLLEIQSNAKKEKINVNVGVLAYNHEKYIVQCLNSIIAQKGNFNLKVIICEDKSTDKTAQIIDNYIKNIPISKGISFEYLKNMKNLGMVKNLKQLLKACSKSKYTALIDGDDCWADESKLQTHIEFMENHPECSMSFDNIIIMDFENKYGFFGLQQQLKGNIFTTQDITNANIIGNISCCFYYSKYFDKLPDKLFEMFVGDWMLNIFYSQFGDIGNIKNAMTIYRKNINGIWTGMNKYEMNQNTMALIDDYNQFLNYTYDEQFTNIRNLMTDKFDTRYLENYDLVIVDDVFPHPLSDFRYQEFLSYFEHFNSMKVLSTGTGIHLLGNETLEELIVNFKRKFPKTRGKLEKFSSLNNINCKLLYFVFLGNVISFVELAEKRGIPFIFTLYPGGNFRLNNVYIDNLLKRVLSSPCFRKVIVTKQEIYDYLISKHLCKPEQILFIFGKIFPLNNIEREYINKKHFKIDKDVLDICFVKDRYIAAYGQNKAYELFINAAKQLVKMHKNIHFHVVGNFDKKVVNISDIKDYITFYGPQLPDWFEEFYRDKDIILSSNLSHEIVASSFDIFPPTSSIYAGLCKTAIFCADPLNLNNGRIKNNEEIVIINPISSEIINKIEYYYNHPKELKNICEKGYIAIKNLYGFNNQIAPRINLLEANIAK